MISHIYNHHQFIYQWKAPLIICFESNTRTTPYQIPFDKTIYKNLSVQYKHLWVLFTKDDN